MSEFAKKVKTFYDLGLWNERKVRDAVEKGKITSEEFEGITGKKL